MKYLILVKVVLLLAVSAKAEALRYSTETEVRFECVCTSKKNPTKRDTVILEFSKGAKVPVLPSSELSAAALAKCQALDANFGLGSAQNPNACERLTTINDSPELCVPLIGVSGQDIIGERYECEKLPKAEQDACHEEVEKKVEAIHRCFS